MKLTRLLLLVLAASLLIACSSVVYKQDIQQGNVLDSKEVNRLEPGMTKRQVEVLLGTPSIASPFHQQRWDYINSYSRRGGKPTLRVLTLHFEGNLLRSMEGNYLDEADVAEEVLRRLGQLGDDTPIQSLDTLREEEKRGQPGK